MTQSPYTKKYPQPYSSSHVINNSSDGLIRADEPLYVRKFPKFLSKLYSKQVVFHPNNLPTVRIAASPTAQVTLAIDDRSSSRKSLDIRSPARTTSASSQQTRFKTLGKSADVGAKIIQSGSPATKSPTHMSALPSDFEHIFHYSETQ